MFFGELGELEKLIRGSGTVIVCLKDGQKVGGKKFGLEKLVAKWQNALILDPEDDSFEPKAKAQKNYISIAQVRALGERILLSQREEQFFVLKNAEKLNEDAANALLKMLEEPREKCHFVLFTGEPGAILATIRSRAAVYAPRILDALEAAPVSSEANLKLAKRILTANAAEIIAIVQEIYKKPADKRRNMTLEVVGTAIELAYKSFFKTQNKAFLVKVPGLIEAYEGIRANGNLRLQFVANLI